MASTNGFDPDKIVKSVKCHLATNLEAFKRFAALDSNAERVDFALKIIDELHQKPPVIVDLKSDLRAEEIRKEANNFFKMHRDEEALRGYTESAAHARGDDTLSLAFANRSALLFEKKFYRECLIDIANALNTGQYPENLRAKLIARKKKAEELLRNQAVLRPYEEMPIIAGKNDLIECASDCVRIQITEDLGRHVVAARDIRVGEVVAIERPFAHILLPEYNLSHCHHCLKSSLNLIPCENCTKALFCSVECKQSSQLYHKFECPILKVLFDGNVGKMCLIALRVALKSLPHPREEISKIYRSENYAEIHNLMTNTRVRPPVDLLERATTTALIYLLLTNCNHFNANEMRFKENHLRHLQTAPTNFHEISELDGKCESMEIAAGAYAFFSLLNHACCPNVVRHSYGSAIVLRTLRPIRKDQQLLDNYGYHYAVMTKGDRHNQLRQQYYFDCRCEACEGNWPLYQHIPLKGWREVASPEDIGKLRAGDPVTAKRLLPVLLDKLEEWDKLRPCREICDLEEILKQCYAIFANKMISI